MLTMPSLPLVFRQSPRWRSQRAAGSRRRRHARVDEIGEVGQDPGLEPGIIRKRVGETLRMIPRNRSRTRRARRRTRRDRRCRVRDSARATAPTAGGHPAMREGPSWLGLIGKASVWGLPGRGTGQRRRADRIRLAVGFLVEHAARRRHPGDVLDHGIDVARGTPAGQAGDDAATVRRRAPRERHAVRPQARTRRVDLDGDGQGDRQGDEPVTVTSTLGSAWLFKNVASVCASSPSSAPSAGTTKPRRGGPRAQARADDTPGPARCWRWAAASDAKSAGDTQRSRVSNVGGAVLRSESAVCGRCPRRRAAAAAPR